MKFLLSQMFFFLHLSNAGKFWLNMNFWLSFIEEGKNNLRRSNISSILYLNSGKHLIVIKEQTAFHEVNCDIQLKKCASELENGDYHTMALVPDRTAAPINHPNSALCTKNVGPSNVF